MKKNCIKIPIDNSSKISPGLIRNVSKNQSNNPLSNHSSFDIHYNSYTKSSNTQSKIKIPKTSKDLLLLKRKDLYPLLNSQDLRKENYHISTYRKDRTTETDLNQEDTKSSTYKPSLNNGKIFNGKQNKFVIKNVYDNNNIIEEKNNENNYFYESKYTKQLNNEKNNNFVNNKITDKIIVYHNENKNISNLQDDNVPKRIIFDSNFGIRTEITNSALKKHSSELNYTKGNNNSNKKTPINTNNTQTIYNNPIHIQNNAISSKTIHLETLSDTYRSPIKKMKIENSYNSFRENNNNNKIEKNVPSKSFEKIISIKKVEYSQKKNDNRNVSKNKKIELIKDQKLNIIEMKKKTNSALKKIPFSPKPKINKNAINHLTKNTCSYTTAKSKECQTTSSGHKKVNDRIKSNSIKGIKLINYKNFKKSISSEYDYANNIDKDNSINSISQSKSNTIHIINSNSVNEESQNKIVNISYNSRIDSINTSNNSNGKKQNLILNRLKKGKIELVNQDLNNKLVKRLNSHKRLTNNNGKKDIPKSDNNSRVIEHSQRYIGDNTSNKNYNNTNYSYKNNSNKNIPVVNSKIFTKFNNNNNNHIDENGIKKDLSKNNNYIHNVTISKVNPSDKSHVSTVNNKNSSNLLKIIQTPTQKQKNRRYLSEISKYESRPRAQISENKNINDDDEDWDNNEYMGLRKKTFDPGRGKNNIKNNLCNLIKNNFLGSELLTHQTYIKYCESITVAGKRENGRKKINQDSYIIERNINGILDFNIFGVLDGHGDYGHYASQFVTRYMISHIKNHPLLKKCGEAQEIYQKLILNGYKIIANLFTDADIEIQKEKFDCKNSGTTCVIVIQLEDKIICANTGDSRAILIYDNNYNNNLTNTKIYPLSYDCKPDLPNERKRIYECGGTVERALDENDEEGGPYRVWALGEDYPGLAMSRSIGDMDAKKIGVIPNPQIVEYSINNNSKYMLICSDGVWEFISNEDAMKIGNKFYLRNDAMGLCQELYKKSVDFWEKEDECIDDITAIAVFF